jgi:hypothetical protein
VALKLPVGVMPIDSSSCVVPGEAAAYSGTKGLAAAGIDPAGPT